MAISVIKKSWIGALALFFACFLSIAGWSEEIIEKLEDDIEDSIKYIEASTEKEFIGKLGDTAIKYLGDKTISQQERRRRFKRLFKANFDSKAIAEFVLGRYKRRASLDELNHYKSLFEEHTAELYSNRFAEYNNEKFRVTRSIPHKKLGEWVISEIIRENGPPLKIKWLVSKDKKTGRLQIYDVVVEGVSMSVTQRSEYSAIIQRGGGKVAALIEALEKKLKAS